MELILSFLSLLSSTRGISFMRKSGTARLDSNVKTFAAFLDSNKPQKPVADEASESNHLTERERFTSVG